MPRPPGRRRYLRRPTSSTSLTHYQIWRFAILRGSSIFAWKNARSQTRNFGNEHQQLKFAPEEGTKTTSTNAFSQVTTSISKVSPRFARSKILNFSPRFTQSQWKWNQLKVDYSIKTKLLFGVHALVSFWTIFRWFSYYFQKWKNVIRQVTYIL